MIDDFILLSVTQGFFFWTNTLGYVLGKMKSNEQNIVFFCLNIPAPGLQDLKMIFLDPDFREYIHPRGAIVQSQCNLELFRIGPDENT